MDLKVDTQYQEMEQVPRRPAYISRLLEAGSNRKVKEEEGYKSFLFEAQNAHAAINTSKDLAINCSASVLPLGVAYKLATTNRSLELIFYFYSRLQDASVQLGTEAPTFEQIHWASNTMSFLELTIFCRDFSVIPTLISKDELRFIWRVTAPQWEGNLDQRSCRFCDFPDMLVRIAIVAYNKPMMKALLITEFGYMPTAADLVKTLCSYLKLDDMGWVKHRIATIGRETMKSLNFRSVGEVNEHAKEDLRNEIAGKRLAKFMAKEVKHKGMVEKQAKPANAGNVHDSDEKDSSLGKSRSENDHKQIEKVASKLQLNATGMTAESKSDKPTGDGNKGDKQDSKENQEPDFSKMSPLDRIFAEAKHTLSQEAADDSAIKKTESNEYSGALESSRQKFDRFEHQIITPDQERALMNIDHSLRYILNDYTQMMTSDMVESSMRNKEKSSNCDNPDEDPNFIASGSSYVDVGMIPLKSKVAVSITMTNKGGDDMLFDVVARDLEEQDAVIKVIPTAIAPGLHRTIKLLLKPIPRANGTRYIMGYVDIYYKYKRSTKPISCVSCPIYYKVGHVEEKHRNNRDNTGHVIPRCTTKTMERILHKYRMESTIHYA